MLLFRGSSEINKLTFKGGTTVTILKSIDQVFYTENARRVIVVILPNIHKITNPFFLYRVNK